MFDWTDERVEAVKKAAAEGMSASFIVERVLQGGCSRNAVIGKLHRLGLSVRNGQRATKVRKKAGFQPKNPREVAERKNAIRLAKAGIEPGIREISHAQSKRPVPAPDREVVALLRSQPDAPPRVTSIIDLEPHHCRWPCGDPKATDFGWCGDHKVDGKSYCERHAARAEAPRPVYRPNMPKVSRAPLMPTRLMRRVFA